MVLLGHVAVWSVPCPTGGTASAGSEIAAAHAEHDGHAAMTHGAADANTTVAATCRCGCDQRPQRAGIALAPGLALLPKAPALGAFAAMGLPLGELPFHADDWRSPPPDHVPLLSLS